MRNLWTKSTPHNLEGDYWRDRALKPGSHSSPSREGFTHPASGSSPDSRFVGLAAFPTLGSVASWLALHDHSGGAVPDFHRLPY